jgi:hypothetical protein
MAFTTRLWISESARLAAVVSARSRNRFGRLVYNDLLAHKNCDPKLLDHEFFAQMFHGYGSFVVPQVRVVDCLPIDCCAGDNYTIVGMDLALCTASVHETQDGKTRRGWRFGWMDPRRDQQKPDAKRTARIHAFSQDRHAGPSITICTSIHVFLASDNEHHFFNGYVHPFLLPHGVNPQSLARALQLPEPSLDTRDTPHQVALAKLAALAQGNDILNDPEHGPVLNRRKEACLTMAEFYHAPVKEIVKSSMGGIIGHGDLGFNNPYVEHKLRPLPNARREACGTFQRDLGL